MPFSAINTYEQELKQRNERHTLEIQLEQAMQTYQNALEAQRIEDFDKAHEHYVKLFAFDVIKSGKSTTSEGTAQISNTDSSRDAETTASVKNLQLGPAIRLRAMALKNFALLLLSEKQLESSVINEAITYLSEALNLVGNDDKDKLIIPSLVQISWALGYHRLARLGLEILAQNNEKGALQPLEQWVSDKGKSKKLFGPRTIGVLEALDYIIELESGTVEFNSKVPAILEDYSNLTSIRAEQPSLAEALESESQIQVLLSSDSWEALIGSINGVLNSAAKRGKRKLPKDNYAWSTKDLWNLHFTGISLQRYGVSESANGDTLQTESATIESGDHEAERPDDIHIQNSVTVSTPSPLHDLENTPHSASTPEASRKDFNGDPSRQPVYNFETDYDRADAFNNGTLPDHGSPVKRRRTERVKRSALALPADFGILDNNFASQFNLFLSIIKCDKPLKFYSPAPLFLEPSQSNDAQLSGAARLRDLLTSWDSKESNRFLQEATSERPKNGGVINTLRKSNASAFQNKPHVDEQEESGEHEDIIDESWAIESFVAKYNNLHIQQTRWHLAREMLDQLISSSRSIKFGQSVFKLIEEIESLFWSRRVFLRTEESTAVFALFADSWIREGTPELENKVTRWRFWSSLSPNLPHAWIATFVDQEGDTTNPESSVAQFETILHELISREIESQHGDFSTEFLFSYLPEIPPLTIANAQMQISKFKAAVAFERVLAPQATEETNKHDQSAATMEDIQLLEAMLMPNSHLKPESTSSEEFEAIQNFLEYSQPQFKTGLWYTLLEKYEANGSAEDSLIGLTQIFLEAMKAFEVGEPLLETLSIAHDVGKRLVPLLERNPDILNAHCNEEDALTMLGEIINLIQTLQLFLLYDEAVNSNLLQKPITTSWPKAQSKFRELVVLWWCIFYKFWLRCVSQESQQASETINDILSIVHERLGNLGYCGVAQGCLLNLHLSEIARIGWDGSALDLSQCLKCKYGLNVSLYGETANHHNVPVSLEYKDAALLLPSVMRMILNHRSFNQIVMRMDTRAVIDAFADAYTSSYSDAQQRKRQLIQDYLEGDFSPVTLRRAWNGTTNSKLSFADGDDGCGIWLVQAGILMNQYRMRRRQAYAASSVKTESLETAIALYIDDISARPTRLESWVGLAQAYTYICEDILTFGDDLMVGHEPKVYCRKGLLASCSAVCLLVNEQSVEFESPIVVAQKELSESSKRAIWSLFGYQLILAVMPPLTGAPLHATARPLRPLLIELPNAENARLGVRRPENVDENLALKIASRCLSKSSDPQQAWIYAMHRCLAAFKLKLPPLEIIGYAEQASELSPSGIFDADIEIIRLVWEFYHQDLLSEELAYRTLKKLVARKEIGYNMLYEKASVLQSIQAILRWFCSKDKWLHRPHFLLAKIYELDHNDTLNAQEQLMHLFTLRSPTKPLVIWKSGSDLPGQHAVYVSRYVRYMTDLMYANCDSEGLLLMARRFRRTGTEMWNHFTTYEYIYGHACQLVRKLIRPETSQKSKYSDILMSEIADNTERFEVGVKSMSSAFQMDMSSGEKWIQALIYMMELRRLHSGPATLAQADELLLIIFLTALRRYMPSNADLERVHRAETPSRLVQNTEGNENGSSKAFDVTNFPNEQSARKPEKQASKKKLIRKDVIHAAQQFLKSFQQSSVKNDDPVMPTDLNS